MVLTIRVVLKHLQPLLPMLKVAGSVLCCMVVINFAFVLISKQFPQWLPPGEEFNGYIYDCHQRVALAELELKTGKLDARQPLCVIIGASSGRQGIELSSLTEQDGLPYKYLGLCAAGHRIEVLESIAEPVLNGKLNPELAILVVSPHQIRNVYTGTTSTPVAWDWLRTHRIDVQYAIEQKAKQARSLLFDEFQVDWDIQRHAMKLGDLPEGIPPSYLEQQRDPFRGMMIADWSDVISGRRLQKAIATYRKRDYSNPARFSSDSSQLRRLMDLIDRFHQIGTKVMVVLPPERSHLRQMVAKEALESLKFAIDKNFGGDVPLFDCRSEFPDEFLRDLGHLNTTGRAKFTELLASQIGNHIPSQTPLAKATRTESHPSTDKTAKTSAKSKRR